MTDQAVTAPLYGIHDFELSADAPEPFAVELTATFEHESGRTIAALPGFYDGDGRWGVRFSPTRPGTWRGRTTCEVEALNDVELPALKCEETVDTNLRGVLGADPARARRLAWATGEPFVPIGFECDWLFSLHQRSEADFARLVDLLRERGFNYIVTNVYAHTGFSDASLDFVYGPPDLYVFGGTNDEPDHATLNVDFFRRFDEMMRQLQARGITAHLMIHVQNKHVNWPVRYSPEDDRYWRYVVARYQAFGNVVWDVSKECHNYVGEFGHVAYPLSRVAMIRHHDAYGHLVTAHDPFVRSAGRSGPLDDACDYVSDQVHLGDTDAYNREAARRFRMLGRPYLNIEYGYEEGVEDIGTYTSGTIAPWPDVLAWTWAICVGGGYPCYYYTNTSWDLIKFDPEPPGWRRYRYLADFLAEADLNRMTPDNEYVAGGVCCADAGRAYLAYLPVGGDLTIDLSAVDSAAGVTCRWLDTHSGQTADVTLTPETHERGGTHGGRLWHFLTKVASPLDDASAPAAVLVRAV